MLIVIDDRVWVPVEITMLGSGPFMDAWRFGVDEWRRYAHETGRRGGSHGYHPHRYSRASGATGHQGPVQQGRRLRRAAALRALELSGRSIPEFETTLYINLSKAHFKLTSYDDAESFYQLAAAVDHCVMDLLERVFALSHSYDRRASLFLGVDR